MANHTESDRLLDVQSGASYLREQSFVSKTTMGVLGFCRGGHDAMLFGARSRDIDAVVAFHPAPMKRENLTRLKHVPVQIHHGTADESVAVTNSKDTHKWLKAQGTPVELFLYEGANHGFLAYTRPFYKPDAAKLAWDRVVKFLHKNLK
jgi:carboxymethylenebutenolidase